MVNGRDLHEKQDKKKVIKYGHSKNPVISLELIIFKEILTMRSEDEFRE